MIPPKVVAVAIRAQNGLFASTPDQRKVFIEKKAHVWRAFARYLAKMSYGKCWYSESKDVHSFPDVDHYRPKKSARRSEGEVDDGYPWLAFSWENFRFSSQRANRLSTDEVTDETVGKGDWFPLLANSKIATWDDRCEAVERPVLLDPTKLGDVRLIEVKASGLMGPSKLCLGQVQRDRVAQSIKLYGLDLPGIVEARQVAMREAKILIEDIEKTIETADKIGDLGQLIADNLPIDEKLSRLQEMTRPQKPFTAAIRAQMREMGFGEYCLRDEELGAPA